MHAKVKLHKHRTPVSQQNIALYKYYHYCSRQPSEAGCHWLLVKKVVKATSTPTSMGTFLSLIHAYGTVLFGLFAPLLGGC